LPRSISSRFGATLLVPELVGGARDGAVLVGQVLGTEDLLRVRSSIRNAQPFVLGNVTAAVAILSFYNLSKIPAAP